MAFGWCMCHYTWMVAYGLPLSCLLWPHGVMECLCTFFVMHLGGIWGDRAIGKAVYSLLFANIVMPAAYTLLIRRSRAWTALGFWSFVFVGGRMLAFWAHKRTTAGSTEVSAKTDSNAGDPFEKSSANAMFLFPIKKNIRAKGTFGLQRISQNGRKNEVVILFARLLI